MQLNHFESIKSDSQNLIEDLTDEELAACVGGCDLSVTASSQEVVNVPLVEGIPVLGECVVKASFLGIQYDPNGSRRSVASDRNIKEAISEVNTQEILHGIVNLPITSWQYKHQDASVRHIGPMAQDFAATFQVGDSDRTINIVDGMGVSLAAIQALYQLIQEKDSQLSELRAELHQLKQHIHSTVSK
ncbi:MULTISPECIES: tail fiber domain-containing protein [Nostocales]|uniref:Tail fiber domain-containing protein n=3 Tax=Nostocales TaxID=1161 RepID=A0A8S9SXP6_9CYAN|nr:tail fiber domain-containing protein [Tolypothrix bouteillei]KAF3884122.1 tail fiber domain-containing protein [Tolypothrix bouteillei VB521301]